MHRNAEGQAQAIFWRRFRMYSRDRTFSDWCEPSMPDAGGEVYLRQILGMPRRGKKPIDYDMANLMFAEHYIETVMTPGWTREKSAVLANQMVRWISEQGFYIELNHTEYSSRLPVQ